MMHFVIPLSFAYLLWLHKREHFARFTGAFLLLSYAALMTFLVFPAAPPWLAYMCLRDGDHATQRLGGVGRGGANRSGHTSGRPWVLDPQWPARAGFSRGTSLLPELNG